MFKMEIKPKLLLSTQSDISTTHHISSVLFLDLPIRLHVDGSLHLGFEAVHTEGRKEESVSYSCTNSKEMSSENSK
jgi:hypothetical protein